METKDAVRLTDKKSIVQKIVGEFRKALVTKALKPGDKLPTEIELARKFYVSRNMVREAIKMLVALGVVEIRRGEGTYIIENISAPVVDPLVFNLLLSGGVPEELLELREMLEVGILEIVLKKVTEEDIHKMERAIDLLEEDYRKGETDKKVLSKHDLDFHYVFAGATHNPLIMKIARTIWEMFRVSIGEVIYSETEEPVRRHRKILEAVKERSLEKAKEAIYQALEKWGKIL